RIEEVPRAGEVSGLDRAPRRQRQVELRGASERAQPLELALRACAIARGHERVVAREARAVRDPVAALEADRVAPRPIEDDTVGLGDERRVRERALRALERGARAIEQALAAGDLRLEGVEQRDLRG